VQHLESLNDQIWQSTGIRVRETIPDWVVKQADEVVMVDLTPKALLNRLARGVVYSPERARAALENFFKEPTLVALRELAMRQTAHAVQSRHELDVEPASAMADRLELRSQERLLLFITPDPSSAALIRRGRRVADYLRADCFAVSVLKRADLQDLAAEPRDHLQRHLDFARGLHIDTQVLEGDDVAATIVNFARARGVTQIFVTRQHESGLRSWLSGGLVQQIVHLARDMQVTIVADRSTRRTGT
jgi:two-component system sensor histidine kinase KdpD